jgi:hypothetical protein
MYKIVLLLAAAVLIAAPINAYACPASYAPCGEQNQLCCPI